MPLSPKPNISEKYFRSFCPQYRRNRLEDCWNSRWLWVFFPPWPYFSALLQAGHQGSTIRSGRILLGRLRERRPLRLQQISSIGVRRALSGTPYPQAKGAKGWPRKSGWISFCSIAEGSWNAFRLLACFRRSRVHSRRIVAGERPNPGPHEMVLPALPGKLG